MNKKTKYYFLLKYLIFMFVFVLVIGALIKIAAIYQYIDPNLFSVIIIILKLIKTMLIIAVCLDGLYLVYKIGSYLQSRFYIRYKINVFEALFKGIVDMYIIYDKIFSCVDNNSIEIDFKENIITCSRKEKYYSFLFIDLFGKVDAKEESSIWVSESKAKKKFGRVTYKNKIKFANPIIVNKNYVKDLKVKTGKTYGVYVIISGFNKVKLKTDRVITAYDVTNVFD